MDADMSQPQEDEYLDWSPRRRICLPPGTADGYMLIPVRDFQRLRKRLGHELAPREGNLPAAYFALFGATIAVAAALPPLMTSSGQPSWIVPTFIVSAAAFSILGTVLAIISRGLKTRRRETMAELAEEMREIENTYLRKPQVPETSGYQSDSAWS